MRKNKTVRVLVAQEIIERNLPLRQGDVRSDDFIFKHYYVRINKHSGEETRKVYEQWCSPKSWSNEKKNKAKQKKKNSSSNREFIRRVKSIYGCSVCGYKKSLMALHFHHIGPKRGEVSSMLGYSRKALKEEVRNCILVCSNCHCEIHEDEQKEV
jgi:5-methylcytosine-specific restriction endonuclease McrA